MIEDIQQDARNRMSKSIESFKAELSKIRTGRAHPSLLNHITVDYYGSEVPLGQAANITVEDARTLAVTAWDKSMVSVIEKAIMTSDLGLNPSTAGTIIRVPMPPLTEANNDLKTLAADKDISEDDEHRGHDLVQKVTDQSTDEIESLLQTKEKELMEI